MTPYLHSQQTNLFHSDACQGSSDGQTNKKRDLNILEALASKSFENRKPNFTCLLLNIPQKKNNLFNHFKHVWDAAAFKIAVDGSANMLSKADLLDTADIVCGDFDSINLELMESLKKNISKAPTLIETPRQNATDFTKAVIISNSFKPHIHTFVALYYNDGFRLDHVFGLINTLLINSQQKKKLYIINMHTNSVSWILTPGKHEIRKKPGREFCSVVPFAGSAIVTSSGLEYDMYNSHLSFNANISVCNLTRKNCDVISIETDSPVLWTIELNKNYES